MYKKSRISVAVALALGSLASAGVLAQSSQRVEITGSSIKRVDAETSLPVTVIKREDIERSGFTTAADLIQSLPSMQGFITASKSVNGGGGGVTAFGCADRRFWVASWLGDYGGRLWVSVRAALAGGVWVARGRAYLIGALTWVRKTSVGVVGWLLARIRGRSADCCLTSACT